MYQQIVLSRRI